MQLLLLLVLLHLVLGLLESVRHRLLLVNERMLDLLRFGLLAKLSTVHGRNLAVMVAILGRVVLYQLRVDVYHLVLAGAVSKLLLSLELLVRLVELGAIDSLGGEEADGGSLASAFVERFRIQALWHRGWLAEGRLEATLLYTGRHYGRSCDLVGVARLGCLFELLLLTTFG